MFGFIKKIKPIVDRPSTTLGTVTDKELLMVVQSYGYSVYKHIKEDDEIYYSLYHPNFKLDMAMDRIMTDRVIKELEAS